ncbi:hypothetical protein D3C78_1486590 [compost metagenome]
MRTLPAMSRAARPISPLPALLLIMVRSRAPVAIRPSISSDGMPAVPKPPTMMVEPSVIPSTALAMDSYVLLIKASSWLFLELWLSGWPERVKRWGLSALEMAC